MSTRSHGDACCASAALFLLAATAEAQAHFAPLSKGNAVEHTIPSRDLFVGDLDGDVAPDAVVWVEDEARLRLAHGLGNGHFEFVDATALPAFPLFPTRITGGDLDADGDVDLVVSTAASGADALRILRNTGGRFTDVTTALSPGTADDLHFVEVADLDRNGTQDLVGLRYGVLTVLLNPGNGAFVAQARPGFSDPSLGRILARDLDGDGAADLLCTGSSRTVYWRNTGNANFVDSTATHLGPVGNPQNFRLGDVLALGDLDGDGDLDLFQGDVQGSNQSIFAAAWPNDGLGRFALRSPMFSIDVSGHGQAASIGDFDGDADADIFLAAAGRNVLLRNEASAGWALVALPSLREEIACAASDLDLDGTAEAVCTSAEGAPLVFARDGLGSMRLLADIRHRRVEPRTQWQQPEHVDSFADFDGDGAAERILELDTEIAVQPNDGTGWFGALRRLPTPRFDGLVQCTKAVDYDADGDLDLVAAITMENGSPVPFLQLYRNEGTGRFETEPVPLTAARGVTFVWEIEAIDVDRDGDPDFVLHLDGVLSAFELTATGALVDHTAQWIPALPAGLGRIVRGDYDGDGDDDLFVTPFAATGPLVVLRNQSTAFVVDGNHHIGQWNVSEAAAGDMDGDGDDDLVVDLAGSLVTVLHQSGVASTFVNSIGTAPGAPVWERKLLADVDDDGDLDLCVANHALYLNDGTGLLTASPGDEREFGLKTSPTSPWSGAHAKFADLDGDGDPDLVRTNGLDVWMSMNLVHQLHAPDFLRLGRPARFEIYARYGTPRAFDLAVPYVAAGSANLALPGLGTWRLDPNTAIALPAVFVPQPDSKATVLLSVPSSPTFLGLPLHAQAAIVHYPSRIALTNATVDVVGF